MGYCDDENLVLPIEINDGIWKYIEHKSLRSMQIGRIALWEPTNISKSAEQDVAEFLGRQHVLFRIPKGCEIGFATGSFMNPKIFTSRQWHADQLQFLPTNR